MIEIAVAVVPWLVLVPLLWANLRPVQPDAHAAESSRQAAQRRG